MKQAEERKKKEKTSLTNKTNEIEQNKRNLQTQRNLYQILDKTMETMKQDYETQIKEREFFIKDRGKRYEIVKYESDIKISQLKEEMLKNQKVIFQ